MRILPGGIAVIENDTHHGVWVEQCGCLVHDPWFAGEICKHIKPGDVVIDGGANIGTIARAMLDVGAKVIAFEPNQEAVECLLMNCPEAEIACFALSDAIKSVGLSKSENAGASFIVPGDGLCSMPLDYFDLSPSLIKLDIEGYEVKALQGARNTIKRCKPVLIVEVNRGALERAGNSEDELIGLIKELGYSHRILQHNCSKGSPMYDLECLPEIAR